MSKKELRHFVINYAIENGSIITLPNSDVRQVKLDLDGLVELCEKLYKKGKDNE